MLKKFTLVMAALVGAALVLIGCPTEAETETKYVNVPEMIHLDVVASSLKDLTDSLAEQGDLSIGLTGNVDLSAALTVPDGKVVYILPEAELDVGTSALTVDGIVYVGGTLTAESTGVVKIPGSGHVGVVKGGALSVETAASVNDGATPTPVTVLGSSKVGFASEITLTLAATGTTVNDITTALGYFSNGTLDASVSTAVKGLKPSAAVTEFGTLVSAAKTLVIEANATEDANTLNVPAGLAISTDEALDSVTALTVNGGLNASSGTFGGLNANVSGTGILIAGVATAGTAKYIIESSLKYAELESTAITDADLEIPVNTVRVFTGAAAPSGGVTVNGALNVSTSLTIAAGKALDIAADGVVALTGTGSLVLATDSPTSVGKITGAGTLTAGATTITGAWEATASGSSPGTLTIASASAVTATITADGTNATGLKASAAGATITQLAGTTNNALTIGEKTEINLAGTGTTKAGEITLVSGANPGKLTFAAATSKVLVGAGTGGSAISGLTGLAIGGKAIVNSGLAADDFKNDSGKLVLLGGTTAGNFTASTTADTDVEINSTVAASDTA